MFHRLFIPIVFIIILPTIIFSQKVILLKIDGAINPASAAFIERGIENAADKNAECLIIEMNTPGGLLESTRNIVSAMLDSKIPIVVYVAPVVHMRVPQECSSPWQRTLPRWHQEQISALLIR